MATLLTAVAALLVGFDALVVLVMTAAALGDRFERRRPP
jgi:hypothetical protein